MKQWKFSMAVGVVAGCGAGGGSRSASPEVAPAEEVTVAEDTGLAEDAGNADLADPPSVGLPSSCAERVIVSLDSAHGPLEVTCLGSGETAVLLHGLGEDERGMEALADALAPTHRTLALDWSQREDLSLAALAADASAVAAAAGGVVTLIGADAGALVAWTAAATTPDAVARVLAIDAAPPGALNAAPEALSRWAAHTTTEALSALVGDPELAANYAAELWAKRDPAAFFAANLVDGVLAPLAPVAQPALLALATGPTPAAFGEPLFPLSSLVGLDTSAPAALAWLLPGGPGALERTRATELAAALAAMDAPPEPWEVPAGTVGQAASLSPLPAFENVVDEKGLAVTAADLKGRPTVLWFYPKAATFG